MSATAEVTTGRIMPQIKSSAGFPRHLPLFECILPRVFCFVLIYSMILQGLPPSPETIARGLQLSTKKSAKFLMILSDTIGA